MYPLLCHKFVPRTGDKKTKTHQDLSALVLHGPQKHEAGMVRVHERARERKRGRGPAYMLACMCDYAVVIEKAFVEQELFTLLLYEII